MYTVTNKKRNNRQQITTTIDADLLLATKLDCITNGVTLNTLLETLLSNYLQSNNNTTANV
jgi:hypothetical protein